jgi:hypothetical protein
VGRQAASGGGRGTKALRLEDEAGSTAGGVPESFDVAERNGPDGGIEWSGGGRGEEIGDGAADLVEGGTAESTAQEFEAGAAEGGGG